MALRLDHCDMSDPYIAAAVASAQRAMHEAQPYMPPWLLAQLPYMEEADLRRVEEMRQRESQVAEETRRRIEPQLQARIDAAVADREKALKLEDKERADARKRVDPYVLAEENARRRGEIAAPRRGEPAKPINYAETLAARSAQTVCGPAPRIDQDDWQWRGRPKFASMEEQAAAGLRQQRAEMERWGTIEGSKSK